MKAKDRVTIYVCTNADGSDKYPLSIIGKSKAPRCFPRGYVKPMRYYNQKKAWSDSRVFKEWFTDFENHIKRTKKSQVLLILDNCGPHPSGGFDSEWIRVNNCHPTALLSTSPWTWVSSPL
jgi:DDE superfamily endonuclease